MQGSTENPLCDLCFILDLLWTYVDFRWIYVEYMWTFIGQQSLLGARTLLSPSGDQILNHAGVKCNALADEQLHIAHSCG